MTRRAIFSSRWSAASEGKVTGSIAVSQDGGGGSDYTAKLKSAWFVGDKFARLTSLRTPVRNQLERDILAERRGRRLVAGREGSGGEPRHDGRHLEKSPRSNSANRPISG